MSPKPSTHMPLSLVWLRRDLRLHDHAALAEASMRGQILPVFVFDTEILSRFPRKDDARLSFIADALMAMQHQLSPHGGSIVFLHGRPQEEIPKLAKAAGASQVFCAEDYEPEARARDAAVGKSLSALDIGFHALKDQLIHAPQRVLKADGSPYKVFTPYSKVWRAAMAPTDVAEKTVVLRNVAWADAKPFQKLPASDAKSLLKAVCYDYAPHPRWSAEDSQKRLRYFAGRPISNYKSARDRMDEEGTSRLSPYVRFGLVSVRECVRAAVECPNHDTWLNELIWREFYAQILYHFPESATQEFQEKYRHLAWSRDEALLECWKAGMTGYPVVDAAMRQLTQEGWMHNRARMIVASFLTKDLRLDWRLGEAHFAQWLMDYDMASNVGGWQWAASTGTDAQPYFRIFNPVSQGKKFDPEGAYVRKYVQELRDVPTKEIHMPSALFRPKTYPTPIVDHASSRIHALAMFKEII